MWTCIHETHYEHLMIILRAYLPCCNCYLNLFYKFHGAGFVSLICRHFIHETHYEHLMIVLRTYLPCCNCFVNLVCLQDFFDFLHIYCYNFCKSHSWTSIHETYYEHLMIVLRVYLPCWNCYVKILCLQ